MNQTEMSIAVVEGPKGTAEVFELVDAKSGSLEYQVRFEGKIETYKAMGEAYIVAGEKAGVKT